MKWGGGGGGVGRRFYGSSLGESEISKKESAGKRRVGLLNSRACKIARHATSTPAVHASLPLARQSCIASLPSQLPAKHADGQPAPPCKSLAAACPTTAPTAPCRCPAHPSGGWSAARAASCAAAPAAPPLPGCAAAQAPPGRPHRRGDHAGRPAPAARSLDRAPRATRGGVQLAARQLRRRRAQRLPPRPQPAPHPPGAPTAPAAGVARLGAIAGHALPAAVASPAGRQPAAAGGRALEHPPASTGSGRQEYSEAIW